MSGVTRHSVGEAVRKVEEAQERASAILKKWLPPGTRVVFMHGNMRPAPATVVEVFTFMHHMDVILRNERTGVTRRVHWTYVIRKEGGES